MYNKVTVTSDGKMGGGKAISPAIQVEVESSKKITTPGPSKGKYRNTLKMGLPVEVKNGRASSTYVKTSFNSAVELTPGNYDVKIYEAEIDGQKLVYIAL